MMHDGLSLDCSRMLCRCMRGQTHTICLNEIIRSRTNIQTGLHCVSPLFQKATFSALDVRKGGRKIYLAAYSPLVTNTGIPERFWFCAPRDLSQ